MNKENILYPECLVWLVQWYLDTYYHSRWGQLLHCILPFIAPFILAMFPLWYIQDVMANIFDWICMRIFVDLPFWGLTRAMEYERMKTL